MGNDPDAPPPADLKRLIDAIDDAQVDWLLKELSLPSLAERRAMREKEEREFTAYIALLFEGPP